MQLSDKYAMLGQLENSIECYKSGLEIHKQVRGEMDPRVGETCWYLAEAHVQVMQFDEAEKLCQHALDIHKEHSIPASLEEAADRRLMTLICDGKGDYEAALEHLVFSHFCQTLADLYYKKGKLRESKTYCENSLRIYNKPVVGHPPEDIAGGLTELSAIYEAMSEPEQALCLLQKALKILDDAPVGKLRASGERKSSFFGVVLNQMGLACIQRYAINEAADLFEEAKSILEEVCGPYHPDTLAVYSNLAGTYDAMGGSVDVVFVSIFSLDGLNGFSISKLIFTSLESLLDSMVGGSIGVLECVVGMREEKLGTTNPDVDNQKKRLAELLKEVGRARNRKAKSLETLLQSNSMKKKREKAK
eukprot:PITA_08117